MTPTAGIDVATMIGTAYIAGLAVLAILMLLRGKRDEATNEAPMFLPLLARCISEQRFDPSMRANPDRVN
jgi:hypothetical protein